MLRHKTETRPGLVALYDIRSGNRVDLFLQPRSPHGAGGNDSVLCICLSVNVTESCQRILKKFTEGWGV